MLLDQGTGGLHGRGEGGGVACVRGRDVYGERGRGQHSVHHVYRGVDVGKGGIGRGHHQGGEGCAEVRHVGCIFTDEMKSCLVNVWCFQLVAFHNNGLK